MNNTISPLNQWLAEIKLESGKQNEVWDPGFDGSRQIVISQLGPYLKIFKRPSDFKSRFHHRIYLLPIEDWQLNLVKQLYGGFCRLDIKLSIRFQATIRYATNHYEFLPEINQHIKSTSEIVIKDAIDQELQQLDDGDWIETGLPSVEKKIQTLINEALILQHIQCRALCEMHPTFMEVNDQTNIDDPFTREDIYLKVLKKKFDFLERQNQERFKQEQDLEKQRIEQMQKLMEQKNTEEELKIKEQKMNAESTKRQLEDREKHLSDQFSVEERLHIEQVKHQARLKELEQEAYREADRRQQIKHFETELQLLDEKLKHQQILKDKERSAELKDFEEQQTKWSAAKERMQLEKIEQEKRLKKLETEAAFKIEEIKMKEEQKLQERLRQEKLAHESRMREMELSLQMEEQKKRYEASKDADEYLRRDIELLILEKQRSDLLNAVKQARHEEMQSVIQLPPQNETNQKQEDTEPREEPKKYNNPYPYSSVK